MPNLIVIRGPVGAGKTTTMKAVCESLPNTTALEVDALKRMIDPRVRSPWRREIAERTSLYLAQDLLLAGRSVVTETHSRWPRQAERFADVARQAPNTQFFSFLVTAPLEVCIARATERQLPDIQYPIDEALVAQYYTGLEPVLGETVIDTGHSSPEKAAELIVQTVLECNKTKMMEV